MGAPRWPPVHPQAFGPSGLIANRAGELEILAREAAGVVGGEDERHGVVADVDVGMVAGGLGEAAHPVDERQRLPEIAEPIRPAQLAAGDRKSTRLNSSHVSISYAVFCLQKKTAPSRCARRANSSPA